MKKILFNILLVFKKFNLSNDIFYIFINKYFKELLLGTIKRNQLELLHNKNCIVRTYNNKTYIFKSYSNNGKIWKPVCCYSDKKDNIIFEYGLQNISIIDKNIKRELFKKLFCKINDIYSDEYLLFNERTDNYLNTYSILFNSYNIEQTDIYFILENKFIKLYLVILYNDIICLLLYPKEKKNNIKIISNYSRYSHKLDKYKYIYSNLSQINKKKNFY